MDGYIPIPSPRSSLSRGCFDPLVATQTVGGQCRCSDDDDNDDYDDEEDNSDDDEEEE